jgi:hypothetical protein
MGEKLSGLRSPLYSLHGHDFDLAVREFTPVAFVLLLSLVVRIGVKPRSALFSGKFMILIIQQLSFDLFWAPFYSQH